MNVSLHLRNEVILLLLLAGALFLVLSSIWYRYFLQMRFPYTLLLAFSAEVSAMVLLYIHGRPMEGPVMHWNIREEYGSNVNSFFSVVGFGVVLLLGFGLIAKLYRAWLLGLGRPVELQGGAAGFRAWLGPANVVPILLFAAVSWLSMNCPFLTTTLGAAALFAIYPLARTLFGASAAPAEQEDAGEERRRVLALVEAGKINAEEASELISALGQSAMRRDPPLKRLGPDRLLMLVGAAVLLIGFMLPWFDFNLGREVLAAQQRISGTFQSFGLAAPLPEGPIPTMNGSVPDIEIISRGGDIRYGIGWIILAAGIASAVLPLVWPPREMNRQLQRGISLGLAVLGSTLLLYVLTGSPRGATIGLYLAIAGYIAIWLGLVREYLLPVRTGRVALA